MTKSIANETEDRLLDTVVQVVTTTETKEEAHQIATAVVEQHLAACVQVLGPITSIYWWQGKVETAEEWLCLIKSRQSAYPELEQAIRTLHSYEVPEILCFATVNGSQDYQAWLLAHVKK